MKALFLVLTASVIHTAVDASPDEGSFIPLRGASPQVEVTNGEIVEKTKARRLIPTRVVFRLDTEGREQYWLELHFTSVVDPGDYYLFLIDGQQYDGFVVRGIEQDRCRWALGFKNPKVGRELLRKIATVYELTKEQVEDQT